jgi:hypothetical protein
VASSLRAGKQTETVRPRFEAATFALGKSRDRYVRNEQSCHVGAPPLTRLLPDEMNVLGATGTGYHGGDIIKSG